MEGKALRLYSHADEISGLTQAQLMERCSVNGSVVSNNLGIALAAEQLTKNEGKILFDIA